MNDYVNKLFGELTRRNKEAYYEHKEDVPVPPEKVYHASPYAREILEQGLVINPEKQTFGGHGTYVSTTNLDEALEYARDLKIVVGFINDEFGWDQLEAQLNNVGIASGLGMAIANYATNELFRIEDHESVLPVDLKGKHPYSEEMQEFFKTAYFNGVDFEGNPIAPEQELKRRWEVLHAGNYLQGENRRFVLLVGDIPEHLLGRSMSDVGVVELVHAPVATDTPTSYERYTKDQTKGKYTYNESENEWRFYDTSDLWPVGIIEAAVRKKATLVAYHGSDEPDLAELEGNQPNYAHGGDIGWGVYVSKNFDTAAAYGKYVYTLDVNVTDNEIFDLSVENQNTVENYEGTSVLVGEFIPPFYFFINDQKYLVSFGDEDIGVQQAGRAMFLRALEDLVPADIVEVIAQLEDIPDSDDVVDAVGEHLAAQGETDAGIDLRIKELAKVIDDAGNEAAEWQKANEALVIDLSDIGAEVEAAGYKAVYFERAGTIGDEILVFDPKNIKIRNVVKKGRTMAHLGNAIKLLSAYEHLNTWEEIFNQAVQDGIAGIEAGLVQLPEDVKAKITDLAKKEFLRIVGDPTELAQDLANNGGRTEGLGSVKDYIYDEAIGATRSEGYYLLERMSGSDSDYTEVLKLMEERGW